MNCRFFILFLLPLCAFSCDNNFDSDTGIHKEALEHVKKKIDYINKTDIRGGSFIFITDTHVTSNFLNSPQQIRYILNQTPIDKVIWGGDAISAYGNNIEEQWDWHCNAFDAFLKGHGEFYKVRGNHDFTLKQSKTSEGGRTLSQHQTFQYLFSNHPKGIVLNTNDPDGCYYYVDDDNSKIRYIILDTDDSVNEGNVPWGVVNGVHDLQLDWIANIAILSIPNNYSIIFISHIPITDTTSECYPTYRNVLQLVNAVNTRGTGNIGPVWYDFSSLENVKVILYLSGHMHHDMQTYQSGVLHVVTASDAAYGDYLSDPFVLDKSGRHGTNAQCFDGVCVDKSKEKISFIRFGVGGNRFFHLQPVRLKVGEEALLNISQKGDAFTWHSYNSSGNSYANWVWTLSNTIVAVDGQGVVSGIVPGEAVVLNMNERGDKEFYNVIVEE